MADASVSSLASFSANGSIPLHLILLLYDAKVEAQLAFSRWLFVGLPNSADKLDHALESWALKILGAPWWRNGAVATSEMGWCISGHGLAVRDAAKRRARILQCPVDDLYRKIFSLADEERCGWAGRSAQALLEWGITDWPDWRGSAHAYKHYVGVRAAESCHKAWVDKVAKHLSNKQAQGIPYTVFQKTRGGVMKGMDGRCFSKELLASLRGWSRVRAGLPTLRCINGSMSMARHQGCIFCNTQGIRNGTKHALGSCTLFRTDREAFMEAAGVPAYTSPDALSALILGSQPLSPGFGEAVALAHKVDWRASQFWKSKGNLVWL